MHALLAIFDLKGRPVDEAVSERMLAAQRHRPREAQRQWRAPGCWLGAVSWPTTALESRERQPYFDDAPPGELCVVLDGRIDNRAELQQALGLNEQERTGGDASLLLKAYRRWGRGALSRIIGDYALVLLDISAGRLLLARDPSGVRPLYYALHDHTLLVASELSCLRAAGVSGDVDEDSVVERLFNNVFGNDRTLYRSIRRLPPAHALSVAAGGSPSLSRFYSWRDAPEIRLPSDEAYAEGFREVLTEAVRCRLRSLHPVALELSGGLDSSSICVLASELGEVSQRPAFSLIFPGLPCDESQYIQLITQECKFYHDACEPTHVHMAIAERQAQRDLDVPAYPNGVMSRPLRIAACEAGCKVTLTGSGSDEWWTGSRVRSAELLRRGALVTGLRHLWQQSERGAYPMYALRGLGPLLPHSLRALRQRLRRHEAPWPWIRPALLARTTTLARMRTSPRWELSHDVARQEITRVVEAGWVFHAYEMEAREAASYGLEIRQPFTDRRVCEWALGVPLDQRARGGVIKHLLRMAMRAGVGRAEARGLPEPIRTRSSKVEFSHLYLYALRAAQRELDGERLQIHQRGWVDQAQLWRAVEAISGRSRKHSGGDVPAPEDSSAVQSLWNAVALELWLRAAHPRESDG